MRENPPEKVDLTKVVRNILSEKPRVTRVPVKWDNLDENPEPVQDENVDFDESGLNSCSGFKDDTAYQQEMEV